MKFNSTEIGERLGKYLESKAIGLNELGRKAETSGSQIRNVISGRNFTIGILQNIMNALPDLNPEWLLFDRGEMEIQGDSANNILNGNNNFIGNKNKQKNISGSQEGVVGADYGNVMELQQELKACRDAKDQLSKQLFEVQAELIQTLKGRK